MGERNPLVKSHILGDEIYGGISGLNFKKHLSLFLEEIGDFSFPFCSKLGDFWRVRVIGIV